MNIVFCTSPFQVLVAREVAKATGEKFFGIYLKMSMRLFTSDDGSTSIIAPNM